jgi:hypothetical protein
MLCLLEYLHKHRNFAANLTLEALCFFFYNRGLRGFGAMEILIDKGESGKIGPLHCSLLVAA